MTFRQGNSSSNDRYSKPQSRLNQRIRYDSTDEGCPVMEESGTICGETDTFDVFQEFRRIYEDCIGKLQGTEDGNATLRKLAPFKKLIDDLWEQNTMLVETVEELEQEATCRVTNLQDRLNKSCQKMCECEEDIKALVKIIQSFCKNGVYYPAGLKLNTLCPASVFGVCKKSSIVDQKKEDECEKCTAQSNFVKNSGPQTVCKRAQEKSCIDCDVCETISYSSFASHCSPSKVKSPVDFNNKKFSKKNSSLNSFDQNSEADNDCDCQECIQSINIHCNFNKYSFNFGNETNLENSGCCDSSCMLDNAETDDH